jgi:pimeloyl-ACP methyl ester carboxylesterase
VSDRAARVVRLRRAALQVTGTTLRVMRTPPFAGRPYVLHLPEDYSGDRPYPLLIALAGGPGRAVPMAQGLRAILAGLDAVVVMPDALGEMWWASGPTAAFPTLLREVMGEINVDPNRVWLAGFSNGGSGSFLYATLWPDRFAAVASQMGAGIRQFTGDPPGVANLGALPFLFLHGDRDAIIPKSASEDTVKAIRREASAAPVSLEILPNHGHDLTLGSDDGRTLRFLLDKTRPAFPRRVVFEMRSALNARRDFVEIMKRKGSVARVEAEIGDDDVVRVRTKRVARLRLLLRRELFSGQGPLAVEVDGRRRFEGPLVEDCGMLLESWKETADPFLGYAMALELDLEK